MCEVLESINTSIKGYLTQTILKKYSTPWTAQCGIIISINLNGSINLKSIASESIYNTFGIFWLNRMRGED